MTDALASHAGAGSIHPLTTAEMDAFRMARLAAVETMPYFGHALFALTPLAAPGLGTFAVDARWRLYMDPALLAGPDAWPAITAGAVALHETMHTVRDHAGRAAGLPQPHHHLAWNLATDAEINDDLVAAGAALPDGIVTPGALDLPERGIAEDYYTALARRKAAALAACDDGSAGCGSGAGGSPVPGELPGDEDADVPGLGTADADLVRRRVAADIKAAASQGRGTLPAGLERWASAVLAPPTIPWTRVLRAAVRRAVAGQAGRTDYTYSRPARRRIPRIIRPAKRGPALVIGIVVDTSGSMQQADLDAALAEIDGVLRSSGIARDQVRVLACDAAASTPQRVRSARDIRLTGGGGTDMPAGIAAAGRLRPAPHVIIVLTDGDTPWPERPGRARLVCAVISPDAPAGTPPWAVTVHVPAS
jgi:predicted metal-dependent peptidase